MDSCDQHIPESANISYLLYLSTTDIGEEEVGCMVLLCTIHSDMAGSLLCFLFHFYYVIYLLYVCVCMCTCVFVCKWVNCCVPQNKCGSWRTTCRCCLFPHGSQNGTQGFKLCGKSPTSWTILSVRLLIIN